MIRLLNNVCFLLAALLVTSMSWAKDIDYSLKTIDKSLLEHTNAIVQFDSTYLSITKNGYKSYRKQVFTIFNKYGVSLNSKYLFYNKYNKIQNFTAKLYDSNGKLVKKLGLDKIEDIKANQGSVFFDDNRFKLASFDYYNFPYTIEYEYELVSSQTLNIESCQLYEGENVNILKKDFLLVYDSKLPIKYKTYDLENVKYKYSTENDKTIHKWSVSNFKAIRKEPHAYFEENYYPSVDVTSYLLLLDKYERKCTTWKEFGVFFHWLNKDLDDLPPSFVRELKTMTDTLPSQRAKVEYLYKYLQQNCRYVANEYALKGWQTFDAKTVHANQYGDCKGLSNYMKALLKAVDINSHHVLIKAGANIPNKSLKDDFVKNSFNHMILMVPLDKDSIWLECTSSVNPAGYLGNFTADRDALILTEQGGVVAHTPRYIADQNSVEKTIKCTLKLEETHQMVTTKSVIKGPQQDDLRSLVKMMNNTEMEQYVIKKEPFTGSELIEHQTKVDSLHPSIEETVTFKVPYVVNVQSNAAIISLPMYEIPMPNLGTETTRKNDIEFRENVKYKYTYILKIPEGYQLDYGIRNWETKMSSFNFSQNSKMINDELHVTIEFEQIKGVFPVADFQAYQQNYNKIIANNNLHFKIKNTKNTAQL